MSWDDPRSLPPPPRPDLRPVPSRPDVRPATPRRRFGPARSIALAVGLLLLLSGIGGIVAMRPETTDRPAPADTPARTDARAFRFFARTAGGPVRWNPCEPIRYQIDLGPMGEAAAEDVHDAAARMSEATGIAFTFEGFVNVDILGRFRDRDFVTPGPGGGLEWAPVLVAWRPQEFLLDRGADRDVIGLALPIATRLDRGQFVSGVIVLNADAGLAPGFENGFERGPLILHELGHLIGLGHVRDRSQLMFPRSVSSVTGFGPGDLQGLERLGVSGGCLVVPTAELDAALVQPGILRRS